MAEMRVMAEWLSQFDGSKSWDEIRPVFERTIHRDYAVDTGSDQFGYDQMKVMAEKYANDGTMTHMIKLEKTQNGVEGIFDVHNPDGKVVRLHSNFTFKDDKVVLSRPVDPANYAKVFNQDVLHRGEHGAISVEQ